MQGNGGSKLLESALRNKQVAVAVLGQAVMDEGGIGASGITIFHTNRGEAQQLWAIANSLGYANPFRKKKHRNHHHYGFSIKASKRKELYDQIGPLPNSTKDQIFRHLVNRCPNINIRARGETRKLILQSLQEKPKTILQLMLECGIGASTVRKHLEKLRSQGFVEIHGRYKGCTSKEQTHSESLDSNQKQNLLLKPTPLTWLGNPRSSDLGKFRSFPLINSTYARDDNLRKPVGLVSLLSAFHCFYSSFAFGQSRHVDFTLHFHLHQRLVQHSET